MAEFVFDLNQETALEAEKSGGSYGVLETGIYDITIKHAAINTTKNGNNVVDISIETDTGHETTLWGLCIDPTWASGAENYDYKKWQSLAAIAGMKSGERKPFKLELSNGTVKELVVFTELHGKKIKVALQKELDVYNGEVKERNVFHSFYNEDGKTLSEIVSKKDATAIDKIASRLSDKITKRYKQANSGGASAPVAEEANNTSIFG